LGPLPPPYYGPSVTLEALLNSKFSEAFEVYFVKTNFIKSIEQLHRYNLKKVLILFKVVYKELYCLLFIRPDFVCSLISFNKSGFIKDMMIIFIAKLFCKKVVLYAHGNNLPGFYKESNWLLKFLIKRTVVSSYAGLVLGERLIFNFEKFLPRDRIFIVPSGIEAFGYRNRKRKNSEPIIKVLFLSNLVESKGFFVLLQAIPKVIAQKKEVRFVFAGDFDGSFDKNKVFSYVREKGIENFVEFKGRVAGKEKIDLYFNSDIFVFPTYYRFETFGLVNLEAMQAGLPVITTARGAIPEIIEDGINGFMVKEQDPVDLAEKILILIEDEALRKRMGENNKKKFNEMYTHEKYGERMIEVFNSLA